MKETAKNLNRDGYEADDIIGTFSKEIAAKGMQCVIVSNDKDLCQLVSDPLVIATSAARLSPVRIDSKTRGERTVKMARGAPGNLSSTYSNGEIAYAAEAVLARHPGASGHYGHGEPPDRTADAA